MSMPAMICVSNSMSISSKERVCSRVRPFIGARSVTGAVVPSRAVVRPPAMRILPSCGVILNERRAACAGAIKDLLARVSMLASTLVPLRLMGREMVSLSWSVCPGE